MAKYSNWFDDIIRLSESDRERREKLRAAWIEYDSMVEWQSKPPRRFLETVARKHNVDPMEVLSWYKSQPNDERRDNR